MLVLVIALSAVIIAPATAAENEPETDAAGEPIVAEPIEEDSDTEVYEEAAPGEMYTEKIDLSVTGDPGEEPGGDPDPDPDPGEDTDTVGAITSVKRTTNEATTLGLQWNAANGADGYHVYWRYTESVKDYVLLSTVRGTSLTIRNLKAGHSFSIKIAAYKNDGGNLIEGESKVITAATIPAKVNNFHKTKQTNTATSLAWN